MFSSSYFSSNIDIKETCLKCQSNYSNSELFCLACQSKKSMPCTSEGLNNDSFFNQSLKYSSSSSSSSSSFKSSCAPCVSCSSLSSSYSSISSSSTFSSSSSSSSNMIFTSNGIKEGTSEHFKLIYQDQTYMYDLHWIIIRRVKRRLNKGWCVQFSRMLEERRSIPPWMFEYYNDYVLDTELDTHTWAKINFTK